MMSRKKRRLNYEYESRSRHGEMKCQLCHKEIKAGLSYRWWETANAYLSEHRSCTEDDPKWKEFDKQKQEAQKWDEAYKQACNDFLKKWGSFPEEDCPYCSS
jgi:hypothetical protein